MFVSISTAVYARLLLTGSHGTTGGWVGNQKRVNVVVTVMWCILAGNLL